MLKKIARFLLYLILSLLLLAGGVIGLAYYYKEKIIQLFIVEANKYIQAKVMVEKIELDFWDTFPHFSIDFKNVKIQESLPRSTANFATAGNIYFSFSIKELLDKKYKIKNLLIKDATVNFKVLKNGDNNFTIFKSTGDTSKSTISFDLRDAKLYNVDITYQDESINQKYSGFVKDAKASFALNGDDWDIELKGDLNTKTIKIDDLEFFKDKPVAIESKVVYSRSKETYFIKPSKVKILNAHFKVEGYYRDDDRRYADFKFSEENSDFQTLISFLPPRISNSLKVYKSKGNIYFNGSLKGFVAKKNPLEIKVNFGCSNASFYHPDIKEGIENAYFTGVFFNGGIMGDRASYLTIKDLKAKLRGRDLSGSLEVTNFTDPYLDLSAKSSIDAHYFFTVFPNEIVEKAQGEFDFDIIFKGKASDAKKKKFNELYSSGEVTFRDFGLKFKNYPQAFSSCNGTFVFNKTDLSAKQFSGYLGRTDFYFNGVLGNVIPYLLYKNEPLMLDAEVRSENVDMDELVQSDAKTAQKSQEPYKFVLSPKLSLNLNCKIGRLTFEKFRCARMEGNISLYNRNLELKNIKMDVAKGKINLNANLHQSKDTVFYTDLEFKSDKIQIDSVMYMTNNFGQTFIHYTNIKGFLTSDVKASFILDRYLNIRPKTILMDMTCSVKNGELVNFKPMRNLAKFVREEALEDIKFSELKNTIQIANSTLYIPEMEIRSNITKLSIMGSHTFDNYFEYRIKVPLRNYKKADNLEEEQALEGNQFSGFYLYLILKGTPDGIKIIYDKAAVKEKIKERWQEEKKEFKELFQKGYEQKKIEKEKVKEANQEEYFDF